jgi:Sulfatase
MTDAMDPGALVEARPRAGTWRNRGYGAAALLGVAGLAITQPVLDLFGKNPEFFVAGRYSSTQIVVFALLVAFAPGLAAVAAVRLAWLVHPRAGVVTFALALAGFAFLFGLVVLDHLGVDGPWAVFAGALAFAGVVIYVARTRAPALTFLSYLAIGNVVFLLLFLFASPTAELVVGRASASGQGPVQPPELEGNVVFVIFDELPVTTLMRPDGTINDALYPNFARLAASSTWFRNASSHSSLTTESVPSMLAGTLADDGDLPSYQDHPHNLLSLFGARYPINRYEPVTDMCPPSACESLPGRSVRAALRDSAIVYGHQVLPDELADNLPAIDHSWGAFGDDLGPTGDAVGDAEGDASAVPGGGSATHSTAIDLGDDGFGRWRGLDPDDRSAVGQFNAFDTSISAIDAGPAVHFIHVALPHYPWTLTPWGTSLTRFPEGLGDDRDAPGFERVVEMGYQMHSLQVGAVDVAVGRLIDQLEQTGAWEDALVVVTSDHGTSTLPPDFGRAPTENNRDEVFRIPLFIKAPGQQAGKVRDDVAQTIDILPSVIDLLGVRSGWEFDGHSLYDGSVATTDPEVDPHVEAAFDVAARHAKAFRRDDGWVGLFAVGDQGDLVGTPIDDLSMGEPSDLAWSLEDGDLFDSLPTRDGRVPYMLLGSVISPDAGRPPDLVVAVNGTIAGVVSAHDKSGAGWRLVGMVGPFYRTGANEVVAYQVERTPLGPVLHRVRDRPVS